MNSTFSDPTDFAITKYKKYRILCLDEWEFEHYECKHKCVSENVMQQEVLNLNSEKPGTFWNIPTKILKGFSDVCDAILQNIWNSEIQEK